MAAVTICSDFGASQKKVCHCLPGFPIYLPWRDGTRCHDITFWMLSFRPTFSLSFFTFFKRLFRVVVTCIYEIVNISPNNFDSSLWFIQPSIHSLCNIQPWRTPFPIWNQSIALRPVLTVASCPAYKFLRRRVRWSGIPISWRIFQFVVIHTVKGFSIVNEAEIFLEFPCFFYGPTYIGNLISGSSAFSKSS